MIGIFCLYNVEQDGSFALLRFVEAVVALACVVLEAEACENEEIRVLLSGRWEASSIDVDDIKDADVVFTMLLKDG